MWGYFAQMEGAFEGIISVINPLEQTVFDDVEQLPMRSQLSEPPRRDEIVEALG